MEVDRRTFVAGGMAGALAASPALAATGAVAAAGADALSPFAAAFLAARNAPGMVVGMADARGWSETRAYGYADLDARRPIRPDERFHIGSITKSFTALMILQLMEEGKLRLDAEVAGYLPGLPVRAPFGPVTVHHLLCHSSGLQSEGPAPGWADQTVEQTFAPGSRFHYCNLGYEWLGRIVEARGGEPWAAALHRRVLDPLGMAETSPLIGAAMRRWEVPSYVRREDDRPFPRRGALTRAAPISFTSAAGCIASTARDMNRYVAMLAAKGQGPNGRLLSAEGFALFTRRHIAAAEFGPKGGYAYGWMTDVVDGRPVIRHTGGMNSFMSSIHVDPEAGCGAFASINAQQGYRPVPVTAQALRIGRARAGGSAPPRAPSVDPDADLAVRDYVGDYLRADGGVARVRAAGRGLSVEIAGGGALALESTGDDKFLCRDPRYRLFTCVFRRETPPIETAEGRPNPVLAMEWGRDSFVRRGARPPQLPGGGRDVPPSAPLRDYEGLYVSGGNGWLPSVRIVERGGRLWVDAADLVAPLLSVGGDRFRFADETASPEVAAFSPAAVSPRTLSIGGGAMVRVGDPSMELG